MSRTETGRLSISVTICGVGPVDSTENGKLSVSFNAFMLGPMFTTANGQPVGLAPGRTWVEIMTDTQAANGIHFTP